MESWRRTGDFRQRERRFQHATNRRALWRRKRAAEQTREAIASFEEMLRAEQEKKNAEVDDLPPEAEASYFNNFRASNTLNSVGGNLTRATMRATLGDQSCTQTVRGDDSSSDNGESHARLRHSHSDTQVKPPSTATTADHDPFIGRPPSPLRFYDYGALSPKPQKHRKGEASRHQTTSGFYKQGPHWFSMLDPCLMPPKAWASSTPPPVRWEQDPDRRPFSHDAMWHRRSPMQTAGSSEGFRQRTSSRRQLGLRELDRRREENVLDQDTLDLKGKFPEEPPEEKHDWLADESQEARDPSQILASEIIFGIASVLRASRNRITQLFSAENQGVFGVLEPEEFLRGLVRLGVVDKDTSLQAVVEALSIIDPGSDGRVNIPVVSRAVTGAQKVQGERQKASQRLEQQQQIKISTTYSESLPVEVVKLDRESRSLFNFERSFKKFRNQQRELLARHHELPAAATIPV